MMTNIPWPRTQSEELSMPENWKILDGKKFMWDGENYEGKDLAQTAEEFYQKKGFETKIIEEEGKQLVYTRREVKEVAVEGQP